MEDFLGDRTKISKEKVGSSYDHLSYENILELFECGVEHLAHLVSRVPEDDGGLKLSQLYYDIILQYAESLSIKIPYSLSNRFCQKCHTLLFPGRNCIYRTRKCQAFKNNKIKNFSKLNSASKQSKICIYCKSCNTKTFIQIFTPPIKPLKTNDAFSKSNDALLRSKDAPSGGIDAPLKNNNIPTRTRRRLLESLNSAKRLRESTESEFVGHISL